MLVTSPLQPFRWTVYKRYSLMSLNDYLNYRQEIGYPVDPSIHNFLPSNPDTALIVPDFTSGHIEYDPTDGAFKNFHTKFIRMLNTSNSVPDDDILRWVCKWGLPLETASSLHSRSYIDSDPQTSLYKGTLSDQGMTSGPLNTMIAFNYAEKVLELRTSRTISTTAENANNTPPFYAMFRQTFISMVRELHEAVSIFRLLTTKSNESAVIRRILAGEIEESVPVSPTVIANCYEILRDDFFKRTSIYFNRIAVRPQIDNPDNYRTFTLLPSFRIPDLWGSLWLDFYRHITAPKGKTDSLGYRECKYCHNLFVPRRPNQLYCSGNSPNVKDKFDSCQVLGSRREFYTNNQEAERERAKRYYDENKAEISKRKKRKWMQG